MDLFEVLSFLKESAPNPYTLFEKEAPQIAAKFNELVDAQRSSKVLDPKTKQLINIAIQTANRNPRGYFSMPKWQSRLALQEKKSLRQW